jgi:hypothetical protein
MTVAGRAVAGQAVAGQTIDGQAVEDPPARVDGVDETVARVVGALLPSVAAVAVRDEAVEVDRPGLPPTAVERELLDLVPAALADLRALDRADLALPTAQLLEDVLVTRLVHRRLGPAVPVRTTRTALTAVRAFAEKQEEGRPARSGVLVVADVADWRRRVEEDDRVVVEPLSVPLRLGSDFFAHPAAHHYVDGARSLYLVGPDLQVAGLVRLDLGGADELDVALDRHLAGLVAGGRAWCATVDGHSAVDVVAAGGLHLRRRTAHWRLLDPALLPTCLRRAGLSPADAEVLAGALCALSDARTGTLVLVAGGRTPPLAGVIDTSPCGAALLTHLLGRSLRELRACRALLGILACDGLTIVGTEGELVMTGAIVELGDVRGRPGSGGGRTHAARSASAAGTVAKVSADGQITVFAGGAPRLHLER